MSAEQRKQAQAPQVRLFVPTDAQGLQAIGAIFREYAASLSVDLCFQDFDQELANLPGDYAAPRGQLLLALVAADSYRAQAPTAPVYSDAEQRSWLVAGCGALRPLDAADYPNAAEMKRLFVRPGFRGLGLGRQLAEALLDAARTADYSCVLLDTLDEMEAARALYEDLGFEEVPPYYHNPIAGAHYLKTDL